MQFIYFYGSVQHVIQGKIPDGAMARDDIPAFAVGADKSTPIHLDFILLPDHSELNRIPEEAAKFLQNRGIGGGCADASIVLQKIGKHQMRVHRHMAKY